MSNSIVIPTRYGNLHTQLSRTGVSTATGTLKGELDHRNRRLRFSNVAVTVDGDGITVGYGIEKTDQSDSRFWSSAEHDKSISEVRAAIIEGIGTVITAPRFDELLDQSTRQIAADNATRSSQFTLPTRRNAVARARRELDDAEQALSDTVAYITEQAMTAGLDGDDLSNLLADNGN